MPPTPVGFEALGLRPELLAGLDHLGFAEPTPVQQAAIPAVLGGKDVIIQAETGTGKTLAYGLPLLQGIAGTPLRPRVLVLVPTRELALQVRDVLRTAARKWRPPIHAVVGGEPLEPQLKLVDKGVAVLVGTPGRVLDLMRRKALVLKYVHAVVLDEADEMLLRGFKPDLDAILGHLPEERQTLLVSATVGPEVRSYAAKTLREPQEVGMAEAKAAGTLEHRLVMAPRSGKGPIVEQLLKEHPEQAIVFVHKIEETRRLAMRLRDAGIEAAYLSGELPQENRKETMERFRKGVYRVLVATDVASRGLDIPEVGLVVNYSVPPSADQYIHRAGRTGRAGRLGRVVTLSYREESDDLKRLRQSVSMDVLKVVPKPSKTPVQPWRPPVEEEPVHVQAARAKRPPKIGRHLGWFEDRPEAEQPRGREGRGPAPERKPRPRKPSR